MFSCLCSCLSNWNSLSRPENLLLESDNRTLKLLDFGESRVLSRSGDQDRTGFEPEISDLEFQAPELVSGGPLGTYTDMWAFGVLLYVLLRYKIYIVHYKY